MIHTLSVLCCPAVTSEGFLWNVFLWKGVQPLIITCQSMLQMCVCLCVHFCGFVYAAFISDWQDYVSSRLVDLQGLEMSADILCSCCEVHVYACIYLVVHCMQTSVFFFRYCQFYGQDEFCHYNMFNHHFFNKVRKTSAFDI